VIDLDAPGMFGQVDTAGALDRIFGLPQQVAAAWALTETLDLPDPLRSASDVVLCGMGGSAIGGDLIRSLVEGAIRVPFGIVRGYDLPAYVSEDTLVILSSYSGGTEEVLSNCDQAIAAGARILAVTGGGRLGELASQQKFPKVGFDFQGQPREALGYSALLILGVLIRLGYISNLQAGVEEAVQVLTDLANDVAPGVPAADNPAKQLATRLKGRLPVVYGGGFLTEVARRWKGQFNENAKNWAFFENFPELNHNAIAGYRFPEDLRSRITVLMLSCDRNHPRIALREQITGELLAQAEVAFEKIEAKGTSPISQILSLVYFGDMASYYLALLNGADPTEIDVLNYLKGRLAGVPQKDRS
jgi:glucose/mannose-6-phosphate isomerase